MASATSGIGEEHYNGFNITETWEGRGEETRSFIWQIEGDIDSPQIPEHLRKFSPIIVSFDAEQKKLYINRNFCDAFGVEVEIVEGM